MMTEVIEKNANGFFEEQTERQTDILFSPWRTLSVGHFIFGS
jgi:hypothetical protein